jgi:hypothetical protein
MGGDILRIVSTLRFRHRARFLLLFCLLASTTARSQATYPVSGKIQDETGGTIVGARVLLISLDRIWEVKSDGEGKFEITGVPPASYDELEIGSPGFRLERISLLNVVDHSVDNILVRLRVGGCPQCVVVCSGPDSDISIDGYPQRSDGPNVRGIVRGDGGKELPGVRLLIKGDGRAIEVLSGDHGEFEVTGIEPGTYTLGASQPGFVDARPSAFRVARQNATQLSVGLARPGPCRDQYLKF